MNKYPACDGTPPFHKHVSTRNDFSVTNNTCEKSPYTNIGGQELHSIIEAISNINQTLGTLRYSLSFRAYLPLPTIEVTDECLTNLIANELHRSPERGDVVSDAEENLWLCNFQIKWVKIPTTFDKEPTSNSGNVVESGGILTWTNKRIAEVSKYILDSLEEHVSNKANPHLVTYSQSGAAPATQYLVRATNTDEDIDTPAEAANTTNLVLQVIWRKIRSCGNKIESVDRNLRNSIRDILTATAAHYQNFTNPHRVTPIQLQLENVDNTTDASKPVSSPQKAFIQTEDGYVKELLRQEVLKLHAEIDRTETLLRSEGLSNDTAIRTDFVAGDYRIDTTLTNSIAATNTVVARDRNSALVEHAALNTKIDSVDTKQTTSSVELSRIVDTKADDTRVLEDGIGTNRAPFAGFGGTLKFVLQTLWNKLFTINNALLDVELLIPNQASKMNVLADKEFVNSSISNMASDFITPSAGGDTQFAHFQHLWSGPWFSKGASAIPNKNDYAVYLSDTKELWRASFDGVQWNSQYKVNDTPFTAEQIGSINSGMTDAHRDAFTRHIVTSSNPHNVTKNTIGLDNVVNERQVSSVRFQGFDNLIDPMGGVTLPPYPTSLVLSGVANGDLRGFYPDPLLADTPMARTNLGLGLVNNTSDIDKPISRSTELALSTKSDATHTHTHFINAVQIDGNVDVKSKLTVNNIETSGVIVADSIVSNVINGGAGSTMVFNSAEFNNLSVKGREVITQDVKYPIEPFQYGHLTPEGNSLLDSVVDGKIHNFTFESNVDFAHYLETMNESTFCPYIINSLVKGTFHDSIVLTEAFQFFICENNVALNIYSPCSLDIANSLYKIVSTSLYHYNTMYGVFGIYNIFGSGGCIFVTASVDNKIVNQ